MEDKLTSDHRGLKLQTIIQKLSEHCDVKNPLLLEKNEDNKSSQDVIPVKRQKQRDSVIVRRWSTGPEHPSDVTAVTQLHLSDLNVDQRLTDTKEEVISSKAETPSAPGRISSRIRNLKLNKMASEEEKEPDSELLESTACHQHLAAQSTKKILQQDSNKVVTRKRRRKRKESVKSSWSILSMEDYVNEAPFIQVGNLVGLRQCRLCSVMFVKKEQLISHMKAVHHLDDEVRISNDVAESPQNQCPSKDEKPYKCTQCQSAFRKSSGLKQHVTRQHSQSAPQRSSHAQSASSLKSHNSGDRPYACQVCGKAFKRKHHLQEHSYIHSDDKPYQCDTCHKTFNQRICLTKHLPCREHEKQHKKPNNAKPADTISRKVPKKGQACQVKIQTAGSEVNGSGCDILSRDVHMPSVHESSEWHMKASEAHSVVYGSQCNDKTTNGYNSCESHAPSKSREYEAASLLRSSECVLNSEKDINSRAVVINEHAASHTMARTSQKKAASGDVEYGQ